MKIPSALTAKLDDMINPIALKEMRQAVKGKFVSWVLVLFLVIQLIVISIALMAQEGHSGSMSMGREVFTALLGVMMGTCLLFVPAFTAIRMANERSAADNKMDLLFITSLKPRSIIWGKLFAGICLTVLLFSTTVPFMTMTYLMRGMDIPSVIVLVCMNFLIVIAAVQFAIFLGSFPGGILARSIRFLMGLGTLSFAFTFTMAINSELLREGVGGLLNDPEFWAAAVSIIAVGFCAIGIMFVLSMAMIAAPSSNKAFPVRLFLLLTWLITYIVFAAWSIAEREREIIEVWLVGSMMLCSAAMFISICERKQWGPRIKRAIPKNFLLRLPAFFLYSGAVGGVLFSLLMILASFAAVWLFAFFFDSSLTPFPGLFPSYMYGMKIWPMHDEITTIAMGLALYGFCYTQTALFIESIIGKKKQSPTMPAMTALVLVVLGSIVPMIIGFLLRPNPMHDIDPKWYIGNPFIVFWSDSMRENAVTFTFIWALIIGAVMLPYYIRNALAFKPLPKPVPLETENQITQPTAKPENTNESTI